MRARLALARLGALARAIGRGRFGRDRRGVAAVEFALILPILLTLYVGTVETTQLLTADRRVTLLGATLADLASQASKVKDADLAGMVAAGSAVLSPLPAGATRVRLTSISISGTGSTATATVCWSYASNWTTYARGTVLDTTLVPAAMRAQSNVSFILSQVEYPYTPPIAVLLTGSFVLRSGQLMNPRNIQYVEKSDAASLGKPSPSPGPCV
ncbi:pilus assembly protein [Alsobacter sp. SYSU M60028]|uniref:Pilus assembly protein n=1 Tax=Alsobacter ponti TaxID=2962936 RepID=A0ABT1L9G0_9HYPH|nr:TadE/TadG family type IV pilus assembly protein [Alsobacter ponti]MCP8938132.1 pilus assembly protein [Alsobacter ponti]